jgi:hypothetical protein
MAAGLPEARITVLCRGLRNQTRWHERCGTGRTAMSASDLSPRITGDDYPLTGPSHKVSELDACAMAGGRCAE